MLPGIAGLLAGLLASTASPYAVAYVNTYTSTTAGATQTFSSCDIGAADANREVFIVATAQGGSSVTLTAASTTINGVTVTKATTERSAANRTTSCAFAAVPSGAAGVTITLTYSGSVSECVISVYRVVSRPNAGTNQTDGASDSTTTTSITLSATTINANGFELASGLHLNTNATTGPGGILTQDYDATTASARHFSGSSAIQGSSSTPSQTWSWTGSVQSQVCSWAFG